jgi:hypothetical protein
MLFSLSLLKTIFIAIILYEKSPQVNPFHPQFFHQRPSGGFFRPFGKIFPPKGRFGRTPGIPA